MGTIFSMTGSFNEFIDTITPGAFLLVVLLVVGKYFLKSLKEDGILQGSYLAVINAIQLAVASVIFFIIPYLLDIYFPDQELARWALWVEVFLAGQIYFRNRKHAGNRGLNSFQWHYALLFFAWIIDRWFGILVIGLPLLGMYYFIMSRLAAEVIPSSKPTEKEEEKKEIRARSRVFRSYAWGLQQPLWKSTSHTAGEVEKRIDGAPAPFFQFNGLAWTYPNQVLGISDGPKFSADGPGLIFLGKGQQPFDIVDLRDQSCSSTINAISRDGITFTAKVSVSFRVDREVWGKELHQELRRENTLLRDARELDRNKNGAFPYSFARVKSVLSYRRKKATTSGEEIERWTDHVLSLAEEAAREVLAERSVEDLWRARENENSTAAEEITSAIKNVIARPLHKNGILVLTAKATEFSFKETGLNENESDETARKANDIVEDQQLATWSVEWERQRAIALANGQAESERYQHEARAYAHSILLTAIAEGLQHARNINPNLPRYVIAMRFIGALEEMIEQQPESDKKEGMEARETIRSIKALLQSSSRGE